MDVQNGFRRAVSKQVTGDNVVVPTNIKSCVFVSNVVSNLVESGRYGFHGTAMTLIRPITSPAGSSWGRTYPAPYWLCHCAPHWWICWWCHLAVHTSYPGKTSLDAWLPEESWLQDAHQVVEWNAIFSNHMISNNDQWLGIPNLQWKSTIDAEIGHAHDHVCSGVCKSWQGFTNFMRLSPPCIVEEISVEEPWSMNQRWCTSWDSFRLR